MKQFGAKKRTLTPRFSSTKFQKRKRVLILLSDDFLVKISARKGKKKSTDEFGVYFLKGKKREKRQKICLYFCVCLIFPDLVECPHRYRPRCHCPRCPHTTTSARRRPPSPRPNCLQVAPPAASNSCAAARRTSGRRPARRRPTSSTCLPFRPPFNPAASAARRPVKQDRQTFCWRRRQIIVHRRGLRMIRPVDWGTASFTMTPLMELPGPPGRRCLIPS